MFRIVIVSPDELLTLRLTGSLSGVDGLSVVGTAPDAARALEMVRLTEPHVVFVDISLQPVGDLGLIDSIKAARPGTRVVVVAAEGREVTAHRALTAGADGLLAPTGPDDQVTARLHWLVPEEDPDAGVLAHLVPSQPARGAAGRAHRTR